MRMMSRSGTANMSYGIALLQVLLGREGQVPQGPDVFERSEIDLVGVEGRAVEGDVAVDPVQRGLQPLDLELLQLLAGHHLTFRDCRGARGS